MALIEKLEAIGDAIRAKTGGTDKLTLDAMPAQIESIQTGGGEIPEEAFNISGNCMYKFAGGGWNWFINTYGANIKTSEITTAECMFNNNTTIVNVPFDINYSNSNTSSISMFAYCSALEELPKLNGRVGSFYQMFRNCYRVREIPESWETSVDWDFLNNHTNWMYSRLNDVFYNCYSLRRIPEAIMKKIYNASSSTNGGPSAMFQYCTTLDEIVGFRGINSTQTSNMFSNTFNGCSRLARLVFDTDNGAPLVQSWKSQTIDLSYNLGYGTSFITSYNSGITDDKEVKNAATYEALKNDADWFTGDINFSRYNHDSAVETINSLPDTSAYLAANGGTNTIKFKGAAGASTDGGAINTLTDEEIAVAAAKGWTVTLV